MKQYEAVALALSNLGGVATLGQLYEVTLKIPDCDWTGTNDAFANIRRIVQTRPQLFYRLETGVWGLVAHKEQLQKIQKPENQHSRFQGLAVEVGNFKGFQTYVPPQDKNRSYLNSTLGHITTQKRLPPFTYPELVKACATIDVIWLQERPFNNLQFPMRFIEIENSTDMYNSLRKFMEFQDFQIEFFIVAPEARRRDFEEKRKATAYAKIARRVDFMAYEKLIKLHGDLAELMLTQAQTNF